MATFIPHPRVQHTFNILLFVVFLAGIWAPLATLPFCRPTAVNGDDIENRARVPRPELSWNLESIRTFPDRFEEYVDNEFGLREQLIRWHGRLCVGIYNRSPSPKVRLGRHGWLYFNGDPASDDGSPIQDYTGLHPLPPAQLEALRYLYQDQSDFLRSRGIHYLLVLIPAKPFIYPEYLPGNVRQARTTSWREQLVTYLRAHTDVDVLDLGPSLRSARGSEPLYFRTDTHWNPLGGYHASTEIIRALKPRFSQLEPRPQSLYTRTPPLRKQGDLARLMNLQHAFEETYTNLAPGPEATARNQILSDHEFSPISGSNGDPSSPTAQVYRDSFAEYLYPYLSEYFREVGYEWGQKGTRMKGVETLHPDLVLQVSCDRVLNSNLFYAPRMLEEGSRRRFDQARPIVRFASTDELDGLQHSRGAETRIMPDGLAVFARKGPARVTLPLVVDAATQLPVLRLEIRPERPGFVAVTSPRRPISRGMRPPEIGLGRFRLEKGRNIIHLTLTDPGIQDHITLDFGESPGGYLLQAIELRALPRWETPPMPNSNDLGLGNSSARASHGVGTPGEMD